MSNHLPNPQPGPAQPTHGPVLVNNGQAYVSYCLPAETDPHPALVITVNPPNPLDWEICFTVVKICTDLLGVYYKFLYYNDTADAQERAERTRLALVTGAVDTRAEMEYLCKDVVQRAPPTIVEIENSLRELQGGRTQGFTGMAECVKSVHDCRAFEIRMPLKHFSRFNPVSMVQIHTMIDQIGCIAIEMFPCDVAITLTLVVDTPTDQAQCSRLLRFEDQWFPLTAEGHHEPLHEVVGGDRASCWKVLGPGEQPRRVVHTEAGLELMPLKERLHVRSAVSPN